MNIPDEAYIAAIETAVALYTDEASFGLAIDKAIEAAAPFIAAQALREHAAALERFGHHTDLGKKEGVYAASDFTEARADELDPS